MFQPRSRTIENQLVRGMEELAEGSDELIRGACLDNKKLATVSSEKNSGEM